MKIPGLSAPVSEKEPRKIPVKPDVVPSVKTPGKAVSQSQISSAVLFKTLGLPVDRLSSSILSFAQFFSLPLEPGLLAKIRRQALTAGQPPQTEQTQPERSAQPRSSEGSPQSLSFKAREALSFAAFAAASKGVELTPAGLENYASVMDTESPIDNERRKQGSNKRNPEGSKKQEAQSPEISATGGLSGLKALIFREAEQNPLLRVLNRLPGRNGQRWLVFPFSFIEQGEEYRLCLKILLDETSNQRLSNNGLTAGLMTLEITIGSVGKDAVGKSGSKQRWLFVMDTENGVNPRLRVCLEPLSPKRVLKSLVSELSQSLQIAPERITIQNFADSSPFSTFRQNKVLLSINEEV